MSGMIPESIHRSLSLVLFVPLSPFPSMILLKERKKKRKKERRDHISIHSLLFVIRLQIESLSSFLHLSINTGSIKPSRAHSDLSQQQTFPLFPLILALSLDWSPVNAHTLKIVIIVLSCWITCGGWRGLGIAVPWISAFTVYLNDVLEFMAHISSQITCSLSFWWDQSHWLLGFCDVSFTAEEEIQCWRISLI